MATVESQFVPVRVAGKMEGTREGADPSPPLFLSFPRIASRRRRDDRVGVSPRRGKNFFLLRGCPCFARGRQTPLFDPLSFPIASAPVSSRSFRNVIHSRGGDPPKSLISSLILYTLPFRFDFMEGGSSSVEIRLYFGNCVLLEKLRVLKVVEKNCGKFLKFLE